MSLSPKKLIMTIVSVLLYLALAVVGEGGWSNFAAHPSLIALALATVGLAAAALFTRGNLSSGEREDRGNRWVLVALIGLGLLLGYLPAVFDRRDVMTLDGDTIRWLGVVLFAAGGVLRIAPVFALGERFSGLVAIQRDHTLVTGGLYGTIRNPSYLGLLISSIGWALAFRSGVGVILVACMLPPLIARMHSEERLLGAQFGAEYEAYRARTWRLIPGLY